MIEERPTLVDIRTHLGDWEVDILIGRNHKQAMVTLTERKSHFTFVSKVKRRTAPIVRQAICNLLLPVKDKVHTLTSDHGKEFAEHQQSAFKIPLEVFYHTAVALIS